MGVINKEVCFWFSCTTLHEVLLALLGNIIIFCTRILVLHIASRNIPLLSPGYRIRMGGSMEFEETFAGLPLDAEPSTIADDEHQTIADDEHQVNIVGRALSEHCVF